MGQGISRDPEADEGHSSGTVASPWNVRHRVNFVTFMRMAFTPVSARARCAGSVRRHVNFASLSLPRDRFRNRSPAPDALSLPI